MHHSTICAPITAPLPTRACLSGARRVGVVLAGALLAVAAPAQRQVVQLTSAMEVHQEARVSPDGMWVAFRGPGKLGVVPFDGGAELTIARSLNIGSFLWDPASNGVYYLDNNDLHYAPASGSTPQSIATLTGQQVQLWCVDSADQVLYGSRFDVSTPSSPTYSIFTVGTNGAGSSDIVTSLLVLDQVRLDPQENSILYRNYLSQPFTPREYFRASVDGTNQVSLTGGPINGCPESADWVDNGQSIAFSMTSPTSSFPHLARLGPVGSQISLLTEGTMLRRFSRVSPDRRWILHQALRASGLGPAVIPTAGGGLVALTVEDNVYYTFQGAATIDAAGVRVAFAASVPGPNPSQVYAIELDRELRIFPRVQPGNSFQLEMPIANNEAGVVFLGGALLPQAIPLGGFTYGLALDPVVLIQIVSGSSATGNLTATVPVPNSGSLIGQTVFFQGFRAVNLTAGDFTRPAATRIF